MAFIFFNSWGVTLGGISLRLILSMTKPATLFAVSRSLKPAFPGNPGIFGWRMYSLPFIKIS
jgi:hypothetical protein